MVRYYTVSVLSVRVENHTIASFTSQSYTVNTTTTLAYTASYAVGSYLFFPSNLLCSPFLLPLCPATGGTVINRTYGTHKNYIFTFFYNLHLFGPVYYAPPSSREGF